MATMQTRLNSMLQDFAQEFFNPSTPEKGAYGQRQLLHSSGRYI
jgi:hypothetical protein